MFLASIGSMLTPGGQSRRWAQAGCSGRPGAGVLVGLAGCTRTPVAGKRDPSAQAANCGANPVSRRLGSNRGVRGAHCHEQG